MPIYAYRCTACGHAKEVLQKMSDPLLSVCPACGASTFTKQVTAAGFQLKGSGWYVTDFRGDNKPAAPKGDADAPKAEPGKAADGSPAPAAAPAAGAAQGDAAKGKPGAPPAAAPAPASGSASGSAPASAPSPAPASASSSTPTAGGSK